MSSIVPTFVLAIDKELLPSFGQIANIITSLQDAQCRVTVHTDPVAIIKDGIARANFDLHLTVNTAKAVDGYRCVSFVIPTFSNICRKLSKSEDPIVYNRMAVPDIRSLSASSFATLHSHARIVCDNLNCSYFSLDQSSDNKFLRSVIEDLAAGRVTHTNTILALTQGADVLNYTYNGTNYTVSASSVVVEEYRELDYSVLKMNTVSFVTSPSLQLSKQSITTAIKNQNKDSFVEDSDFDNIVAFFNLNLPPLVSVKLGVDNGKYYFISATRSFSDKVDTAVRDQIVALTITELISKTLFGEL